jgi:prepilin-type processing-associated H-X9-DG protein
LRDVARPAFLDGRTDRWAIGDRVAWDEPAAGRPGAVKHLPALAAACRPVGAPSQLIHGDLTGNVLFADGLPPLVLDLSPYWRPAPFAAAVVVADALVFEGAGADLAGRLTGEPDGAQYLLRALIFRVVADRLARPDAPVRPDDADPFRPAVELALRLAG